MNLKEFDSNALLPDFLSEEDLNYKSLLLIGLFLIPISIKFIYALIPSIVLIALYIYFEHYNIKVASNRYFTGARSIYLNSLNNKVGLSIALFYADKALELDTNNVKALAIKGFILKAMGYNTEVVNIIERLPVGTSYLDEIKSILTAPQLEDTVNTTCTYESSNHSMEAPIGEEIPVIAENKLETNSSIEPIEISQETVDHSEEIEIIEEPSFSHNTVLLSNTEIISNPSTESLNSEELIVYSIVKDILTNNNKSLEYLKCEHTNKYFDIKLFFRFVRVKLIGKKSYLITDFLLDELKTYPINLKIENTPKSESGKTRIIINTPQDMELLKDIILASYDKCISRIENYKKTAPAAEENIQKYLNS